MFDFINRCLDPGDDYLTGRVVVHALATSSGRGLPGIRVIVGSTLEEAFGKTCGGRRGVTGRDGTCRITFPFGCVFVAVSESDYVQAWLPAEEELGITFRLPSVHGDNHSWPCPMCGLHLTASVSKQMTICPECGCRSFPAGADTGFSRKLVIVSPRLTAGLAGMSEFFQGLMRHLNSESDLIIDLTEVAMTSEAVASIVRLNKKAKVNRLPLPRFVMPRDGPTRQIFEVTCLDRVFQVYTTIDAALASLR